MIIYTRKLRPKGQPFSGFSEMKGKGFHYLKYIEKVGKSVTWV